MAPVLRASSPSPSEGGEASGAPRSSRRRQERDEELQETLRLLEEAADAEEYVPLKKRREMKAKLLQKQMQALEAHLEREEAGRASEDEEDEKKKKESSAALSRARADFRKTLLATSHKLRAEAEAQKKDIEKEMEEEEKRILEQVSKSMGAPLQGVRERAKGIVYTSRMQSSWRLPDKYAEMTLAEANEVRERFFIDVSGEDPPPPFRNFKDMRFPQPILKGLQERGISYPTQIQMQGIPAILQGRDIIGIAFTGSGKTLVFSLPMIMGALESEIRSPYLPGEGPFGLVVCPSRELASQTNDVCSFFCKKLEDGGYPALRCVCIIGGCSAVEQVRTTGNFQPKRP
ncbi:DEAD (Asp-Glu-Ala-Asp) box polypeptide 41 family protein [Toxoplasma gondii RUB]|uniref:DEAD (Asp-Glu-Ala-Asp) box polypeptide 41 family protein n=1 Tax=Toxoplasma gondii RUB TaxID=935652 RepID=A0A086M241_TOXGO|nr:DEAD (Asp-Glu-Ala-Asp) box polypeptide 41 family protein [Toxoplasma gondii RUB]